MFCVMTRTHPWIERISDRFFEVSFDAAFRRMVQGYLKRAGMSARAFGVAVGDARFVARMSRGCAVRLDSADKVLAFMDEPPLRALFLKEIEAFLSITRTKAYVLGLEAVGDRSFVPRLRRGLSPFLGTIDQVRGWMGRHSTKDERRAIGAETLHSSWFQLGVGASAAALPAHVTDGGVVSVSDQLEYMNTKQAAKFLGMGRRTLDRLRMTGDGPPYFKFGHSVRYSRTELQAWAQTRRRVSTSDDGTAGARTA